MYYIIGVTKHGIRKIDDAFEEFEAATEYVTLRYLDAWCQMNDFITLSPCNGWCNGWLIVNLPVGYIKSDNIYTVSYREIIEMKSLKWFPESTKSFMKNRSILMFWMRQTKRL